jgi:3-dehydroquinate dehydratase
MSRPIAAGLPQSLVSIFAFTSRIVDTKSSTGSTRHEKAACGIVINPAAFTHTSVAILDALNTFEATVIEVHISNVHKREEFRHRSFVSLRADGVIAGLGTQGYTLALRRLAHLLDQPAAT